MMAVRKASSAHAYPQLFGFSVASGLSLYYLQQESKVASGLLLASVEELQLGTGKVGHHSSLILQ